MTVLAIVLDHHCNLQCSCCRPTRAPMPEDLIHKAIDSATALPSIELIAFTGGEPTLRRNVLLRAIRRAHDLGFRTRVVTNAWWAATPDKARLTVAELVTAGLDELCDDPRHAPPIQWIVNMARAAQQAKLRVLHAGPELAMTVQPDGAIVVAGDTVGNLYRDALPQRSTSIQIGQ